MTSPMLDARHAAVNKSRSLLSATSAAMGVCVTDKLAGGDRRGWHIL